MTLAPRPRFDWKLRTRTLPLGARTLLMQIVNLTPDSFSGDGLLRGDVAETVAVAEAVAVAIAALDDGADILDLGAESTRPNATPLSSEEEQARLLPVLAAILRARPGAVVSVDTYHADTARAAVAAGAEIVNDVSGLLWDPAMAATVAELRCGLVLMHTRGRPQEWSSLPPLAPAKVLPLVLRELGERLQAALHAGIAAERIVIDPGFGFGKLGAANFALLAGFAELQCLGRPLLAGLSRKRFLGDAVASVQRPDVSPADARQHRTIATSAAHVAAVLGGAHVLRAHDLQAARDAAAVADGVTAAALAAQSDSAA